MGLFSDIYNTVARFFRPQEEQGDASKSVATNRLKLVLMQDRTNLTPKILEQMRSELIDLLSRYVEMDKELLELNFEQEGDQVALMLSIPVIRAKDEDEINATLKQKEAEQHLEEVDNESSEEESSEIIDEKQDEEETAQEPDTSDSADNIELNNEDINNQNSEEEEKTAVPHLVSKPEEMNNSSKTEEGVKKKKEITKE